MAVYLTEKELSSVHAWSTDVDTSCVKDNAFVDALVLSENEMLKKSI